MAICAKDIAKQLNLSESTVSLVLNNRPGISNSTRRKVMDFLEQPECADLLAKSRLTTNPTLNVRFIIYKKHGNIVADTPFFSGLLQGVDDQAKKSGCNLNISYANSKMSKTEIRNSVVNVCNGIVLLASEVDRGDLDKFFDLDIPIVLLDSYFEEIKIDSVIPNNTQGISEATRYLISEGHTNIGYLGSSVTNNNLIERYDAFLNTMKCAGLTVNKKNVYRVMPTIEGAYTDMCRVLSSEQSLPTAFASGNDIIAIGCIKAFKEFGLGIPEDVSVIGFDDISISSLMTPALTTMQVNSKKMGELAVDKIISRIKDKDCNFYNIRIGSSLVERQSVCKLKK